MKPNKTKDNIIRTANMLFKKNGYEKTGIRDIAKACDISISNLQYYYPKKVMIMADVYNLMTSEYYEAQKQEMSSAAEPVVKIMAIEYEFMLRAMSGDGSKDSYISSIAIPEVCNVYIEKSTDLFIEYEVCPDKSRFQILMANTTMYGGVSQILQFYLEHKREYELDDLMVYPFEARLRLLGISNCRDLLELAFTYSKRSAGKAKKLN